MIFSATSNKDLDSNLSPTLLQKAFQYEIKTIKDFCAALDTVGEVEKIPVFKGFYIKETEATSLNIHLFNFSCVTDEGTYIRGIFYANGVLGYNINYHYVPPDKKTDQFKGKYRLHQRK